MEFNKFFQTIAVLTPETVVGFESWLFSPIHKIRPQVKQLFLHLKENAFEPVTSQEIGKKTSLAPHRLNDLINKLQIALEDFCIELEVANALPPIRKETYLLNFYEQVGLAKHHSFVTKRLERLVTQSISGYPDDFYAKYIYHKEIAINRKYLQSSKDQKELEGIVTNLDEFFVYERMKYLIEMYMRNSILGAAYDHNEEQELAILSLAMPHLHVPSIRLLYLILGHVKDASTNLTHRAFLQLKECLQGCTSKSEDEEREIKLFVHFMLNLAIKAINEKKDGFAKEYVDLIQFLHDRNCLLENGELRSNIFKNAITAALKAKAYDWASWLVKEYADFLNDRYKRQMIAFFKASIAFDQCHFKEAETIMLEVTFKIKDVLLQLAMRKLWVKVYVELELFDEATNFIRAFRRQLKQASISGEYQAHYEKFLDYTECLLQHTNFNMIRNDQSVIEHEWFLKKICTLREI